MWRAHHLLLLTYSYINKMEWKRGFWRESGWVLNNNKATFKFYSILDCHFTYAHTPKHIRTSCRRCQPTWWFFRVLHCFFRLIKAFLLSTQYVRVIASPFSVWATSCTLVLSLFVFVFICLPIQIGCLAIFINDKPFPSSCTLKMSPIYQENICIQRNLWSMWENEQQQQQQE